MEYVQNAMSQSKRSFLNRVFGWMACALGITGAVGFVVSQSPALQQLFLTSGLMLALLVIIQLGLVIALSAFIERMSYSTALLCFIAYSVVSGLTFSAIFIVYTLGSIATVFGITAGMFAGMALYGAYTSYDLSAFGIFLRMALWGLLLALIVNMFVGSESFDLMLAWAGVIIFAGLTAFDVQKISQFADRVGAAQGELAMKFSLVAALALYLDFINLFLSLIRILGKKK